MSRLRGTWEVTGGATSPVPAALVVVGLVVLMAGSAVTAAIEAAATLILVAAVAVAVVVVAGLVAALVFLRRYSQRGAYQLAVKAAAMRAAQPARPVAAPAPQVIVNHFHGGTHIHAAVPLGIAEDGRTIQAIPLQRDAITEKERPQPWTP